MQRLSEAVARGRDNNLNLIRQMAAIAVLVSHAWPMVLGPGAVQPLAVATGVSLGTHAVYLFFLLSGFLIAASFERCQGDAAQFWTARGARLFPGLVVANLVVVLGIGALATTWPLAAYLTAPQTLGFLAGNSAIIRPVFALPGVFEGNPYPMVHGSIWTLRHELGCYILLFLLGLAGVLSRRGWLPGVLVLVYPGLWALQAAGGLVLTGVWREFLQLSLPFLLGALAWVWRARIPLSLGGVALAALLAWVLAGSPLGRFAGMLLLGYGGLWLAYVPGGWLRHYNRLGDYSYGTYVYAFPVQGLVVWLWGPTGPLVHCLLALPVTLVLAVASWHWIERPALAFGRRVARPG